MDKTRKQTYTKVIEIPEAEWFAGTLGDLLSDQVAASSYRLSNTIPRSARIGFMPPATAVAEALGTLFGIPSANEEPVWRIKFTWDDDDVEAAEVGKSDERIEVLASRIRMKGNASPAEKDPEQPEAGSPTVGSLAEAKNAFAGATATPED